MTVTIGRRELLAALGGAVVAWPLARERVIGHQGDMFWRAHLKLARQMAGERS
jgi:hypothetical protein